MVPGNGNQGLVETKGLVARVLIDELAEHCPDRGPLASCGSGAMLLELQRRDAEHLCCDAELVGAAKPEGVVDEVHCRSQADPLSGSRCTWVILRRSWALNPTIVDRGTTDLPRKLKNGWT